MEGRRREWEGLVEREGEGESSTNVRKMCPCETAAVVLIYTTMHLLVFVCSILEIIRGSCDSKHHVPVLLVGC